MLPGTWLRTGPLSKVTLTLPDRTQTIIARNSEIQLSAPEGGQSTSIKLNIGKLWSKTNKKPVALTIKAPNAVASIRGTEWVFDVSEDGESSVEEILPSKPEMFSTICGRALRFRFLGKRTRLLCYSS